MYEVITNTKNRTVIVRFDIGQAPIVEVLAGGIGGEYLTARFQEAGGGYFWGLSWRSDAALPVLQWGTGIGVTLDKGSAA